MGSVEIAWEIPWFSDGKLFSLASDSLTRISAGTTLLSQCLRREQLRAKHKRLRTCYMMKPLPSSRRTDDDFACWAPSGVLLALTRRKPPKPSLLTWPPLQAFLEDTASPQMLADCSNTWDGLDTWSGAYFGQLTLLGRTMFSQQANVAKRADAEKPWK